MTLVVTPEVLRSTQQAIESALEQAKRMFSFTLKATQTKMNQLFGKIRFFVC